MKVAWNNISRFCLWASNFLDPLMKNQNEEDKRACHRFLLIISLITPVQVIITPISPLTKEFGMFGVFCGSLVTYSFIFLFVFGKISLFTLRNIIFVQNVLGVHAVSQLGNQIFPNTTLLESFSLYGGAFINPILVKISLFFIINLFLI